MMSATRMHLTILALSVWFILPGSVQADDFTSHVVGISDGDTITVLNPTHRSIYRHETGHDPQSAASRVGH
jgi:hypothetical protein